MVLDCSDNFATRHAVNRACVRYRKPSCPVQPSALMVNWPCSMRAGRIAPVITASFRKEEDVEGAAR